MFCPARITAAKRHSSVGFRIYCIFVDTCECLRECVVTSKMQRIFLQTDQSSVSYSADSSHGLTKARSNLGSARDGGVNQRRLHTTTTKTHTLHVYLQRWPLWAPLGSSLPWSGWGCAAWPPLMPSGCFAGAPRWLWRRPPWRAVYSEARCDRSARPREGWCSLLQGETDRAAQQVLASQKSRF